MKKVIDKEFDGGKISASLSDDELKLFLDISLAEGFEISSAKIISFFEGHIKEDLLDRDILKDVAKTLNEGRPVENRRIAKGVLPKDGRDGRLVFLVKPYGKKIDVNPNQASEKDLKELHLFDNVHEEQTVARIYPPKPGEPGKTALGHPIPSTPGKELKSQHDKTIKINEAVEEEPFLRVVALKEGYLYEDHGKLCVNDELNIKGDVDYRVGNLDFVGKIIIDGNVAQGFRVKAKKGIVVKKELQGGSLISTEGSIEILGQAFGSPGEKVVSQKDVSLNMAQELHVECSQTIYITKEARNCVLRAHSTITCTQADLIGGKALAVCGLEAKSIGNNAGANTEIFLCSNAETSAQYGQLITNIAGHEKAMEMLKVHLGPFAYNQSRLPMLDKKHRIKIETLLSKYKSVLSSYESLLKKRNSMLSEGSYSETTQVNFVESFWPGAVIFVGDHKYKVDKEQKGPATIAWDHEAKEFKVEELKSVVCNFKSGEQP